MSEVGVTSLAVCKHGGSASDGEYKVWLTQRRFTGDKQQLKA